MPRSKTTGRLTADEDADVRAELEALKEDLVAVKEDVGKVTSAAMHQGRAAAQSLKKQAGEEIDQGLEAARSQVQHHPLSSAMIALGAGVCAGILLSRR